MSSKRAPTGQWTLNFSSARSATPIGNSNNPNKHQKKAPSKVGKLEEICHPFFTITANTKRVPAATSDTDAPVAMEYNNWNCNLCQNRYEISFQVGAGFTNPFWHLCRHQFDNNENKLKARYNQLKEEATCPLSAHIKKKFFSPKQKAMAKLRPRIQ